MFILENKDKGNFPDLDALNKKYALLSPLERIEELYKDFEKVLFTSSFGTSSVILLHMFSQVNPKQEVHFIDTTYHFQETLDYKQQLIGLMNLNVVDVLPKDWKNKFTRDDETWTKDTDLCCSINKVEPLEELKPNFEVWISGLMAHQNGHRSDLVIFEKKKDIIKFYPILDMTELESKEYLAKYKLPEHPLQNHGYESIGCAQCTFKGKGREGRWKNSSKTECGLHL